MRNACCLWPEIAGQAVSQFHMLANDRSFCLRSCSAVSMLLNVATCRAQQLQFALNVTAAVLTAFEQLFGVPFTLPKLDLVAIPDFGAGAMENWGLITYRCAALSGVCAMEGWGRITHKCAAFSVSACFELLRSGGWCHGEVGKGTDVPHARAFAA